MYVGEGGVEVSSFPGAKCLFSVIMAVRVSVIVVSGVWGMREREGFRCKFWVYFGHVVCGIRGLFRGDQRFE